MVQFQTQQIGLGNLQLSFGYILVYLGPVIIKTTSGTVLSSAQSKTQSGSSSSNQPNTSPTTAATKITSAKASIGWFSKENLAITIGVIAIIALLLVAVLVLLILSCRKRIGTGMVVWISSFTCFFIRNQFITILRVESQNTELLLLKVKSLTIFSCFWLQYLSTKLVIRNQFDWFSVKITVLIGFSANRRESSQVFSQT